MRHGSYLVVGLAGLGAVLAETQWETQWVTTTSTETAWSTKAAETIWSTTTCWSTKEAETITITSQYEKDFTSYVEKPYTITDTSTEVSVTTEFDTVVKTQTVFETLTALSESDVSFTATATATALSTLTKYITVTETIASVATSLTIIPGKNTIITSVLTIEATKTITGACSSSTLVGLVPCPPRITNTDYSPPTPLPSDYLWGCPPGQLCKPPQVNCNFEADLPSAGYVCAPEDCIPTKPVPSDLGGQFANDWNSTCPWYEAFDSYFNLKPATFGLNYNMFAVSSLGIAAGDCQPTPAPPPPPPPSYTTTSSAPPPPPPPPPVTSTTTWLPWTTSVYVAPPAYSSTSPWHSWTSPSSIYTPPPAVSSSSWAGWAQSSSAAKAWSSSSARGDWQGSSSAGPYAPGITAPPRLLARDSFLAPPICYSACNRPAIFAEHCGLVSASLCALGCPYSVLYTQCQDCVSANKHDIPTAVRSLITQLNQFSDYCLGLVRVPAPTSAPAVQGTTTSKLTTTTPTPTPKPPPTTKPTPSPTTPQTTSTPKSTLTPVTTSTISSTVPIVPQSTTTPSPTTTPVSPETSTLCQVSEFSDGQPQATSCGAAAATTTSANTSVASFTPGNGAQATQRPAAVMVIGVAVIIAMA